MVPVGVGDGEQVVFRVVGVLGGVAGVIGDRGQSVGIIVGVVGYLPVLILHRSAAAAGIVGKAYAGAARIGDAGQAN